MNCLSLAMYVTCLGKADLPDVPYRVSLRLRPRTLHNEIQSVFFHEVIFVVKYQWYLPL